VVLYGGIHFWCGRRCLRGARNECSAPVRLGCDRTSKVYR
jgi:hypothetical protein